MNNRLSIFLFLICLCGCTRVPDNQSILLTLTNGENTVVLKSVIEKNNYDIFWEKENGETGTGIFNGEIGKIIEIDDTSKAIKVEFDDLKKAWYEYNELEQLEHSYAITIHKSQRK